MNETGTPENLVDLSTRPDFKEISAKGGRHKKGSKSLKVVLRELLAAQDPEGEYANPIAKKLLQLGFTKGDYRALVEIVDRIEGKTDQPQVDNKTQIIITTRGDEKKVETRPDRQAVTSVELPD